MAQKNEKDERHLHETQLVTFVLAGEEFGVPIALVKEIVRVPGITRVPKAPAFVEGVANLRGSILPVVNLRERFGLPAEARDDDNRAVVIEIGGRLTGLTVDRVSEVMRVPNDQIEPPPPVLLSSVDSAYLSGVAKLQAGKRLILLLNLDKILPAVDLQQVIDAQARQAGQATGAPAEHQALAEEQLVSFSLAGEEYALPIMQVQEIIRVTEIARIPRAPGFVEGVVALRNRLLPIINLRRRFGLEAIALDEDSRVVVVNLEGTITGLQVDAVSEVLRLPASAIEAPPRILSEGEAGQLRGVAKLNDGKRLLMLLDISRVLSSDEVGQLETLADQDPTGAAPAEADQHELLDEEQYVSFRVENEEFGVNIHQVQEIIWLPEITKVPRAPFFVEGIVNLRGSVLPVIDIRKRFGIASVPPTESTSIVVVDLDGRKTGMIVDAVSEVLRFGRAAVEPPPPVVTGVDASFVKGVGKLQNGQRMLIILELAQVLSLNGQPLAG